MRAHSACRLRLVCCAVATGVLLQLVFSACVGGSQRGGGSDQQFDDASCGKRVETRNGRDLSLSMPVVLGTGYRWQPEHVPSFLAADGEPSFSSRSSGQPGLEQTERFRFKVISAGSDTLTLVHKRPWEPATKETTRCRITLVSHP